VSAFAVAASSPSPSARATATARVVRLLTGLVLFGFSLALMVEADLGLGPWDVLHQGLADRLGVDLGWVAIGIGALVLAAWIPLRERPGLGTAANVVLVGLAVNVSLVLLPALTALAPRVTVLVVGIVANAVATALYIGAGFGPGPRDGLMTGLARRGLSVRTVRTGLELAVLALGVALGGPIGLGTIAFALAIGPLVHLLLPRFATS
jgi:uncharacterized membrane protein YczE